ncbi:MAG: gamma-glutamyltransferase [Gemmatimonadetes bacterium]|nr:gamma-glutamyltransferase [Gemmatimonadota bacterium]
MKTASRQPQDDQCDTMRRLQNGLDSGGVSRRDFVARAAALGLSAASIDLLLAGPAGGAESPGAAGSGATAAAKATGMVVAPQPIAVEVGVQILRRGGNAIDAAIATCLAQGIVTPFSAGIGGYGCMLVYSAKDRKATMLDFHARAGSKASSDVYLKHVEGRIYGHADRWKVKGDVNQTGYLSVCTPGTVAGLHEAWKRWGSLPWADLIEPAARLAEEGFVLVNNLGSTSTESDDGVVPFFIKIKATKASADIYLNNGKIWRRGETLVQRDYARSLRQIAERGPEAFYRGEIAERIVDDFRKNGGLLTREDLENYKVDVYEPVRGTYRGYEIVSNPLPGSGPQVIEILNILEGYDCSSMEHDKADYVELVARAQILSFIDRRRYHGDPKFLDEDPTELLMSKERAAELRRYIERRELPEDVAQGLKEPLDTTTLSAVDGAGNCVAFTHTLGSASGTVTEGLGFTYNNCMFQFEPIPGRPNSIAPGKARITGISPTIVFRDGQPILVHGAAGGTRILGAVQHTINNVIDHGMSAVEAVYAPRWHWEDLVVDIEPRLYYLLRTELEARGLKLNNGGSFAALQAIKIDPRSGRLSGGSDPGSDIGSVGTP